MGMGGCGGGRLTQLDASLSSRQMPWANLTSRIPEHLISPYIKKKK